MKLKNGITKIVHTKETPSFLSDIYSCSSIESIKLFEFLINNNVNRIEIDNITRNIKVKVNKNIKVSLYYPYNIGSKTFVEDDFLKVVDEFEKADNAIELTAEQKEKSDALKQEAIEKLKKHNNIYTFKEVLLFRY